MNIYLITLDLTKTLRTPIWQNTFKRMLSTLETTVLQNTDRWLLQNLV